MTARDDMARELTQEEAVALADSGWWKDMAPGEAARLQMDQRLLCMPFSDFHGDMEKLMGRGVWTHEFANMAALKSELAGNSSPPASPMHSLMEAMGSDAPERTIIVSID